MQKWEKLGLVFCASGHNDLMFSAGRAPTPIMISDDICRIFFASYDTQGRGSVFSLYIDLNTPNKIQDIEMEPILTRGAIGFFDDNGVIPSCAIQSAEETRLYLIGFGVKNKVLFDASMGIARKELSYGKWIKEEGPLLSANLHDKVFATSPWVMRVEDKYLMWYVSCDRFEETPSGLKHYYNIKQRESVDGVEWLSPPTVSINYANDLEYAISRPCVISNQTGFEMYYSYRASTKSEKYQIGYAFSSNGVNWTRMDKSMDRFNAQRQDWEQEMLCYPAVVRWKGASVMFYNGNHYGKSGFGVAIRHK